MSLLRCFLAVALPQSLQDSIEAATAGPRKRLGTDLIRWVPTHNVHLTLKFLGDTSPSGIELIQAALEAFADDDTAAAAARAWRRSAAGVCSWLLRDTREAS